MRDLSNLFGLFVVGALLCLGGVFALWCLGQAPAVWHQLSEISSGNEKRIMWGLLLGAGLLIGLVDEAMER